MKNSENKKKKEIAEVDKEKKREDHEKELKIVSFSIPVIPTLLGIILVLGFAVGVLLNRTCPEAKNCEFTTNTCPKCPTISEGLELLYLMPINCTTCDFRMIQSISNDLNFLIKPYVTDSVQSPMLFIGTKNKATLALANSRYNILTAICEFANEKNACLLKDREFAKNKDAISCLKKYNISSTSVVFLYSDTCSHCARMKPFVRNLENQSYNFTWVNVQDAEKMAMVKDCLLNVLDVHGYVPQFACPITKEFKVGVFTSIEKMKEFADRCINASIK